MKKIYLGSDHRGFDNKEYVKLILNELKIPFVDLGAQSKDSCDYPIVAKNVSKATLKNKSKGILLCGTGIGMSIAANKVKGIRAALVSTPLDAELTRAHNDANILVLSGTLAKPKIKPILMTFFQTRFSGAARHKKRIRELEN